MSFTYNIQSAITTLDSNPIQVVYTATKNITGMVKVKLVRSSTYGVVDLPGTESPDSDLNAIISSRDIKISIDGTNYSEFNNEVVLMSSGMNTGNSGKFYLKFVQSSEWSNGRRLYIGVEVFEAP